MIGVRRRLLSVRERVEKLGIGVDNLCITVEKRWTSARVNPRLRSK